MQGMSYLSTIKKRSFELGKMFEISVPEGLFDDASVDIFGPVSVKKKTLLVTFIVDRMSRYIWYMKTNAAPLTQQIIKRIDEIANDLEKYPKRILSNRGPQFTSNSWKSELAQRNSAVSLASTHYPQGDGITKRAIQKVHSKIQLYAEGLEDRYLDAVEKAVTAVNNNLNVMIGTDKTYK
jgi:transposase InsO family protein